MKSSFFLVVLVLATFGSIVEGTVINDYFANKVFGPNPGPCPTKAQKCETVADPNRLSPDVANLPIRVTIPVGNCCFFTCSPCFTLDVTRTLAEWLQGGLISVWDLKCDRIRLGGLDYYKVGPSSNRYLRSRFDADSIRINCEGTIRFDELNLAYTYDGDRKIQMTLTGEKKFFLRDSTTGTTNVDFDLIYFSTIGTFDEALPEFLRIPKSTCSVNVGADIDIDLDFFEESGWESPTPLLSIDLPSFLSWLGSPWIFSLNTLGTDTQQSLTDFLLRIIEASMNDIACDVLSLSANRFGGGYINTLWDDLGIFIDGLQDDTPDNVLDYDANPLSKIEIQQQGLTAQKIADSIDFSDDDLLEIISVTLNGWLAQTDETGSPVINEVIDNLLGNTEGRFEIKLREQGYKVFGRANLSFTNVTFTLDGVTLEKANTITTFKVMENNYEIGQLPEDRLKSTLNHTLDFQELIFLFNIGLTLRRGEWVSFSTCSTGTAYQFVPSCASDEVYFTFDFGLTLEDLKFSMSTLTHVNPKELDEVQIGQVLGQDFKADTVEALKTALVCLNPMFYSAYIPFFETSIFFISDPVSKITIDTGLAALIGNSVVVFSEIFKEVFRNAAPGISQGTVRPEINGFLKTEVALPPSKVCPPYVWYGDLYGWDLYLNFNTGLASNIFPVINDVLGNTQGDTETDINDLIQVLLEYYSSTIDIFPLLPEEDGLGIVKGFWTAKENFTDILELIAFKSTGNEYIRANNPRIHFLDTITNLRAEYYGTTNNGIKVDFGFGEIVNPPRIGEKLKFTLDWEVETPFYLDGLSEFFKVELRLYEVEAGFVLDHIEVNKDKIYKLKFKQLQFTPCLLTPLENIDVISSKFLAGEIFLSITDYSAPGNPNPFQQALADVQTETAGPASLQVRNMVNTIINNGFANILNEIEEFNTTALSAENCDSADNPLQSYVDLITGFEWPDVTDTVAYCIQDPVDPPLTPLQAEQQIVGLNDGENAYFDLKKSVIVGNIAGIFGNDEDDTTRLSVLRDILQVLANESGTPISDSFFLEEYNGDTSVSFRLPLNDSNWIFDLFGYEPIIFQDDTIIPGLNFQLTDLYIKGIDNFNSKTKFLDVVSKFVTGYRVEFDKNNPLEFQLSGFFEADGSFVGDGPGTKIKEDFTTQFIVDGFYLDFELLTAIKSNVFETKSLGHFFELTPREQDIILAETAQDCLFSCFFENGISVTRLNVSVTEFSGPNLVTSKNILSQSFEDVLDQTLKLLTDFYIDALPNIGQNCIRDFVNDDFDQRYEQAQINSCPDTPTNPPLPKEDQLFRFGTSKAVKRLNQFVNENFIANDFELWNKIIKAITRDGNNGEKPVPLYTNGSYAGFEDMELVYNNVGYGELTMKMTNLKINKADSFNKLQIIVPVDYDNYTTLDGFGVSGRPEVELEFDLDLIANDVFIDMPVLENNLNIKVFLKNFDIGAEVYAVINASTALGIRFSSVSSFNEIPCLLIPINALTFRDFNLSMDDLNFEIKCRNKCDFPLFESIKNGGTYSSSDSENANLARFANDAIQYIVDYVESSSAQDFIDAAVETAEDTCPYIIGTLQGVLDFETSDKLNVAKFMGYVGVGILGFIGLGVGTLLPLHKKRKKQFLKNFLTSMKTLSQEKEILLFKTSLYSLFSHPRTPVLAKFLVPFMCMVHILGLLVAIVFSGAINVIITFVVLGAKTNDIVLVPFTIVSTINDLWNSGAWFLALLIGLASCAWPILKNVFLIIIWFSPGTILSKRKRNKYLLIMDVLGKWSFLDVFVVVMTLAALRTYIQLSMYSRLDYVSPEALQVDVNVTPERGIVLLCFIAATSLIVNHIMSWYHEKVQIYDEKQEDDLRGVILEVPKRAQARVRMLNHSFAGIDRKGRSKMVSKKSFYILTVLNFLSGAAVLAGVCMPLITFNLGGIVGAVLEQIEKELAKKTYSIADLGSLVSEAPSITGLEKFVIIFFQLLFFLTSIVFPALQVLVNYFLFTMRMSLKDQKVFLWMAYLVSFWAALECFLVGIVMTLDQIDQITIYIVDFISDELCSNLKTLLEVALEDGACLSVTGNFESAAPIIFPAVIIQLVVTIFSLQLAEAVINDRYYQSFNGVRKQTKPPKPGRMKKIVLKYMTKSVRRGTRALRKKGTNMPSNSISLTQSFALSKPPSPAQSPRTGSRLENPVYSEPDDIEL